MTKQFSTVQAAVDAIRAGKVVIVVDAEDRENEGDFVCAAETVTTETINFMLRAERQLCAPILPAAAERLELRPIVQQNNAPLQTAFMTPVDYAGSKTGITAAERERRRSGDWLAIRPKRRTLCDPVTSILFWRWRVAFCDARAIPKPPSIWRGWLGWHRPVF